MADVPDNPRGRVLMAANQAVNHDRNATYGDPNQDFARTARYWNNHLLGVFERKSHELGIPVPPELADHLLGLLDPHDVAIFIDLMKTSRLSWSPGHTDNWTDKCGYSACGYHCAVGYGHADPEGLPSTMPPLADIEGFPMTWPVDKDPFNDSHCREWILRFPTIVTGWDEHRLLDEESMSPFEFARATGRSELVPIIEAARQLANTNWTAAVAAQANGASDVVAP